MTLIDRLSKLEGPDWEVSCEIISSLISVDDPDAKDFYGSGQNYTASVDAAIALAERVQSYSIMVLFNDAFIWLHARYPSEKHSKMLPIAFLIAILRAKEASEL